jgi:butyryl-CoA dehydrogenase
MIHHLSDAEMELQANAREAAESLTDLARAADVAGGYNESWHEAREVLHERGYLTMCLPTKSGGWGAGAMDLSLVTEQIASVDGGLANILFHEAVAARAVENAEPEVRERVFGKMARGSLTCIGITEPNAGSDLASMTTTAERSNGGYVINGEKEISSLAGVADIFILWAMTDPGAGTRGITAFVLDDKVTGIKISEARDTLGFRQLPSHHVTLTGVEIPESGRLGDEGAGLKVFSDALNLGRLGGGVQALGIATGAFQRALHFSLDRETFGKLIAEHQAVQFKLAQMFMETETVRSYAYSVARFMDKCKDFGGREVATYVAGLKSYASDMAMRVTEEAVQIFGAQGLWRGNDVERLFRDAKVCQLVDGPNELMKMRIGHSLIRGYV